jgi:hypothetical protein
MPRTVPVMSATELAALAHVSYRQIDRWAVQRFIKEEPREAGTGNKRQFRATEVRICQMMAVMVNAGVSAPVAARAARAAILEVDAAGPVFMSELARGVAVTGRIPA